MSTDSQSVTLIIRSSKLVRFSLLAFHLLLATAGLLLSVYYLNLQTGSNLLAPAYAIDYLVPFCILACAIYALIYGIYAFAGGRRLSLSPQGLAYRLEYEKGFVRWADIESFRLEAPLLGASPHVGWDYPPHKADKPHIWPRLYSETEAGTRLHGDLGSNWQGGAASTYEILESWRVRYGTSETLKPQENSLDLPETAEIHLSLRKYALAIFCLALLILFFGGYYALTLAAPYRNPNAFGLIDFVFIVFLSLMITGLWAFIRRITAKPRLRLDPQGLSIRDEKGQRFIAWNDIAGFKVVTGYNAYVPAQIRWERKPHLAPTRGGQFIGYGFAMKPYALRAMLEDWRIRFKPDA